MKTLYLSSLKASDIPPPEAPGADAVTAFRFRPGRGMEAFVIGKGRDHSGLYYTLLLRDGYKTFDSLAALKRALAA